MLLQRTGPQRLQGSPSNPLPGQCVISMFGPTCRANFLQKECVAVIWIHLRVSEMETPPKKNHLSYWQLFDIVCRGALTTNFNDEEGCPIYEPHLDLFGHIIHSTFYHPYYIITCHFYYPYITHTHTYIYIYLHTHTYIYIISNLEFSLTPYSL